MRQPTRQNLERLAYEKTSYTAFRCACIAAGLTPGEAERLWLGDHSVLTEEQIIAQLSGDEFILTATDKAWIRTDTPVRVRQ